MKATKTHKVEFILEEDDIKVIKAFMKLTRSLGKLLDLDDFGAVDTLFNMENEKVYEYGEEWQE